MSRKSGLTICAIIAARNEYNYLRVLLPKFAEQNIDVAILDNQSQDESHALYEMFWNQPIIKLIEIPFKGYFSLTDQLQAKHAIIKHLTHDWIIHSDADEIMQHRDGRPIRAAILEAESLGYNCLNFDEFVFIPRPGNHFEGSDYYEEMNQYYFFQPETNRLNRAYRRELGTVDPSYNGHQLLSPELRIFPHNHCLRHYIVLSEEHAQRKYLQRHFDSVDLGKGWHRNRLSFSRANLCLPHINPYLSILGKGRSTFSRMNPTVSHYWEW